MVLEAVSVKQNHHGRQARQMGVALGRSTLVVFFGAKMTWIPWKSSSYVTHDALRNKPRLVTIHVEVGVGRGNRDVAELSTKKPSIDVLQLLDDSLKWF